MYSLICVMSGWVLASWCACQMACAYVYPQLGGGQFGMGAAPMKHVDITLVGNTLSVHLDPKVPTPLLRPLIPPDAFDPAMPWAVLQDRDHNFQYGWNASGFWAPPAGASVWIEQLDASPELEVYFVDGLPVSPPYDPIFGTAGSPTIWQWSGAMTHNAYAVLNPTQESYFATYKVYIGDESTGAEWPAYSSAEVTFEFDATAVLTADFNTDHLVDDGDLSIWQQHYGMTSTVTHGDGDADVDGDVDGIDFLNWQRQVTVVPGISAQTLVVPEPTTAVLLLAMLYAGTGRRKE